MSIRQTVVRRLGRLDIYDLISALLIAVLLIIAVSTFRHYSVSNDEDVQRRYGEMIVAYYRSGLADRTLFDFGNLYLYGGLFDVVALLVGYIVPGDIYAIRHVLCAVIGLGGLAAACATARTIAGPRAGAFAAVSLGVCGVWFGTMFNHTKDVPFAAAMIGATYFLLRACRALPRPALHDLLGFGLMLGAALGQRALGLLLLAYVPIAVSIYVPRPWSKVAALRLFGRALLCFIPAFALGYLIMLAGWPWAGASLFNPIRAIFSFTHFEYPIRTLLFGDTYLMADVPRVYEPVYLAIKLPLIVLIGAALGIAAAGVAATRGAPRARLQGLETAFVAVTAGLPVLMHIAGHGPAFSGMRHFIFVVPPLAVLAGIGFDRALALIEARTRVIAATALFGVGAVFLWNASVLMRLHPYEYLYFNPLVGGLAGADQRFDTDYWVNVMHEAVMDLEGVLDKERPSPVPYRVAVCSDAAQFTDEVVSDKRLQLASGAEAADFFIAPTHMKCDAALDGTVIARIARMGTVIGVVKDRRGLTRSNVARAH